MNAIIDDLDDSALFCKSLIQKRKPADSGNLKVSRQLKLDFPQTSKKVKLSRDKQMESNSQKITSESLDSKWDESSSSYFSTKKSINTCPLCLKSFKTDWSYSTHMKQCAKSHNISTRQLLSALELQKKQMQGKLDFGTCSQKCSSPVKTTTKKKKENDAELYDLSLGLALSKSLTGIELKDVPAPEVQKSTLEEFGFKSSNDTVGPSRKVYKKSILKDRTTEERQRIIVEKVAMILLEENQESNFQDKKQISNLQKSQVSPLWNMSENNEKSVWHVNEIKTLVLPSEKNLDKTETLALVGENPKQNTIPALPENIDSEISKLNLPRPEIYKDWSKMINNSNLSDLKAKTKDGHYVYLHSFVLYVKCPEILEKDYEAILKKFNLSTAVCFLEFLYCGTLTGLIRSEVNNLTNLANEFNYKELGKVLNNLRNNLSAEGGNEILNLQENEVKKLEITATKNKKLDSLEDKDLFDEDYEKNEKNFEKSYWGFLLHGKEKDQLEEVQKLEKEKENTTGGRMKETETKRQDEVEIVSKNQSELVGMSDDSATKNLDDVVQRMPINTDSDCIILSSGSDSKLPENPTKSRTPSTGNVDYEVPYFDPYDNFYCFSEEPLSPVAVHSQSLITGDISLESLKLPTLEQEDNKDGLPQKEPKKTFGYFSTPVSVRRSSKVNSAANLQRRSRKRKSCDLSENRILRKSLNLQQKTSSSKKRNKRKQNCQGLAEALTNSIFTELSKSTAFKLTPTGREFIEVTPVSNREEFVDNVTPSPNFSNMGESLLKEQLTKYGLKKSLAKSKARKILRHIYEELHPLYNTETGKFVKKLPTNTLQTKKAKPKACPKVGKLKPSKNDKSEKTEENKLNISTEFALSDGSIMSKDRLTDDSTDSEFENLNETLTQTMPLDLPSAFYELLQSDPDFHERILLYEPIWLEELQRKLQETFKEHFKIADLMDFLDQKCITFRSEAQTKNIQRRNEKKRMRKKEFQQSIIKEK